MGAGSILKNAYIHWWRKRKGYWKISVWIAMVNIGIGIGLYWFDKGVEISGGPLVNIGLLGVIVVLLGIRAAVKIKLIFEVRNGMAGLPEEKVGFGIIWGRYLSACLLMVLPVLVIPMTIWYEAPFCILILRWRMHFVPYTAVLEPDRVLSQNGIRRGQGMVWQVCVTAFGTKCVYGCIWGVLVLSLGLASLNGWMIGAIVCGGVLTAVLEPLYQTGNLLLYRMQYKEQVQPKTFWMDMKEESVLEG